MGLPCCGAFILEEQLLSVAAGTQPSGQRGGRVPAKGCQGADMGGCSWARRSCLCHCHMLVISTVGRTAREPRGCSSPRWGGDDQSQLCSARTLVPITTTPQPGFVLLPRPSLPWGQAGAGVLQGGESHCPGHHLSPQGAELPGYQCTHLLSAGREHPAPPMSTGQPGQRGPCTVPHHCSLQTPHSRAGRSSWSAGPPSRPDPPPG